MSETILGIWDGHDSGAALIRGSRVLAAINEERLTRRKLEINFPENSIKACMSVSGIRPGDINAIAVSTCDFSKTLTRVFPSMKEAYYLIRRRKKAPGFLSGLKKRSKYFLTEIGRSPVTRFVSERQVRSSLKGLGLDGCSIDFIDHHRCHAASAFFSGFDSCLVVTVDGIGDGLSGTLDRKSVV